MGPVPGEVTVQSVNRAILLEPEARVRALQALPTKLRGQDAGESFGDIVARSRPRHVRDSPE